MISIVVTGILGRGMGAGVGPINIEKKCTGCLVVCTGMTLIPLVLIDYFLGLRLS